jgi:hypothetical protein
MATGAAFERSRADDLFQQRKLRSVPIRFNKSLVPFSGVLGSFRADQTMQFRGGSITALALGAPDQYIWSVSVANSDNVATLGETGNTDSTWIEQMGTSGHGAPPAFFSFGSDYDGFYLNLGETLYVLGTNQLTGAPGKSAPGWLLGTVMLYFMPTFRQTGG